MAKRRKFYPETDPRHSSVVETYREEFRKERIDGFHLQVRSLLTQEVAIVGNALEKHFNVVASTAARVERTSVGKLTALVGLWGSFDLIMVTRYAVTSCRRQRWTYHR